MATNVMGNFPRYGGEYITVVQVCLPLILAVLDLLCCKILERSFSKHKDNINGQAMLSGLYIWQMEASRFDCFVALYLSWKEKTRTSRDVFLNSVCSVLGEIWTHSGIRDRGEELWDSNVSILSLKPAFPQIRDSFSSIRAILEWVIPALTLIVISFLELCRDYIAVTDDDFRSQLYFFTTARVFEHIWEILGAYYLVEVISKLLCWLLSKKTGYREISVVGSLGWSSIFSWGVALVLSQDAGFKGFLWTAFSDVN